MTRAHGPKLFLFAVPLLLVACGSTAAPNVETEREREGTMPVGEGEGKGPVIVDPVTGKPVDPAVAAKPIDSPLRTWAFEAFPEAVCNDGTSTGIGVYRTESPNLVIYFQGGGACWDYNTCFTFHTATKGPYQAAQFAEEAPGFERSVLSSAEDKSPYAGWNKVFVPYCTGDVHSGSNVATYKSGNEAQEWHHKGRTNIELYLKRIVATFTNVDRLAISGSSAGGYGAFFNYPLIRNAYPKAHGVLVDDAGPPLSADSVRPQIRDAFAGSWGSIEHVRRECADCVNDWPKFIDVLSQRYPGDRFALLSSLQDETIRAFMGLSGPKMEVQLRALAKAHFDGTANARYFYTTGSKHTFLGSPSTTTSENENLNVWLTRMLDPMSDWASVLPAANP